MSTDTLYIQLLFLFNILYIFARENNLFLKLKLHICILIKIAAENSKF